MKNTIIIATLLVATTMRAGMPDSVWVRPLMHEGDKKNLYIEWSADGKAWSQNISAAILQSDYGAWGSSKNLFSPTMSVDETGLITIKFDVDQRTKHYGVCSTRDFIHIKPQDYHQHAEGESIEPSEPIRLPYSIIEALATHQTASAAKDAKIAELAKDNATRFEGLQTVKANVAVSASAPKAISPMLMGIFFEDINYCADGGLNAELVQNGDFEYEPHDRKGDKNWNQLTAWEKQGNITLDPTTQGVSTNNAHAVSLSGKGALANKGWDGIAVKKGAKYDLSLYAKGGKVRVSLVEEGKTLAATTLAGGKAWKQAKATIVPNANATKANLVIEPVGESVVAIDMVSLMPRDTYKGHGLRRDLAETLEALKPTFMRFPGGCVTHGDGIGNIYHWKETIGNIADRKPARNLWGYHQSRRIGFYEFFQMCEDMGMEPLPVLAAGVPCQNSSDGGAGQQGGIPMDEMQDYIQEILDLIEWANGDASTTWGKKRAEQGHKKPFNLKMIGIGNEDLISDVFTERYLMICRAIKAKYPDIEICGTAGPFYKGSDYEEGWRVATENKDVIDLVDEHYYVAPGWYIHNQDFYDQYDRNAPQVYLGEWAAHGQGKKSTVETALSEAMHFCNIERNGDIVKMSSYAPLLAKEGHTQWNPDMIYFNNTEVKPTVGYYAQMMCGNSQGDQWLASSITTTEKMAGVKERLAVSTVRNTQTGKIYLKLVNILPVEVEADVRLEGVLPVAKTCKKTVLTGAYNSQTARPEESIIELAPQCTLTLPAYSFTLIEL